MFYKFLSFYFAVLLAAPPVELSALATAFLELAGVACFAWDEDPFLLPAGSDFFSSWLWSTEMLRFLPGFFFYAGTFSMELIPWFELRREIELLPTVSKFWCE